MPVYEDIQKWVKAERGLDVTHTCWIAHCKAIARGDNEPGLNAKGEPRVIPCPEGEMREAILDAFRTIGIPNGRRLYFEGEELK